MKQNNREFSILKQRILQFIDNQGIKNSEIYSITGISNGVLSQRGGLSEDSLLKFLNFYKNISLEWLFTGEGEMLQNFSEKSPKNPEKCFEKLTNYIDKLEKENEKLKEENEKLKKETQDEKLNGNLNVARGAGGSSSKKEAC